jgi:hypothetical protein
VRRGGGRSGGGRSFGGRSSGGRSFGGRSSSGGRGGRIFGGGSSSGGGHRIFGGRRWFGRGGGGEWGGGGWEWVPLLVVSFFIIFIALYVGSVIYHVWGGPITGSSYQRTPLPAGAVNETAYIRDDADWLAGENSVENSMRNFFKATGVQPYLWITEKINGSRDASWEEIEKAMNTLYQEQFTDEGHLILLFYEPSKGVYKTAYLAGSAAKTVIDDEASRIILDYFDKYYYSNMEED